MRAALRLVVAALSLAAAIAPAAVAEGVATSGVAKGDLLAGPAATGSKVLHPQLTAAAWYQPDPLCATPLGCGFIPLPPLSPYPKGTFHVGTAAGRQTAEAFIGVNLAKVDEAVRGGTLSIPLDTATTDGSLDPQAAKVKVCVTYQAVADAEGAFDNAPSASCLPAALATYAAKPAPHLVADLKRLSHGLTGIKGFGLLPADLSPTTAWQIVFKLPPATADAGPRPTLRLLLGGTHHASTTSPTHHPSGGETSPPDGGTFVPPTVPAPVLPPAVSVVPPPDTKPVIARVGHFVTVGYQYPQVWLLPLALLVLIPVTVRALTKDLTRRR